MKLYIILLSIAISALVFCCRPNEIGFGGNSSIVGTATVPDTVSTRRLPAVKADVYIGFEKNPTVADYSFKTQTDQNGTFAVDNLTGGHTYYILIIYKSKLGTFDVEYKNKTTDVSVQTIIDAPVSKEFLLESAQTIRKIEGFVKVKDNKTSLNVALPNAVVYTGYNYTPSAGKYLHRLVTDGNGAFASPYMQIDDAQNFQLYIESGSSTTLLSQTLTLAALDAATDKTIVLTKDPNSIDISGKVKWYDYSVAGDGEKIAAPDVNVYVGKGFMPNASNNTFSTKTAQDGSFTFKNVYLPDKPNLQFYFETNYDFNGKKILLTKEYSAIPANFSEVILAPVTLPGIVEILVVDVNKTPQPNVQVCLYSNKTVFDTYKTCEGSFFSKETNQFGKVFVSDLKSTGKYYVRGVVKVENTVLPVKVSAEITIDSSFPQTKEVTLQ